MRNGNAAFVLPLLLGPALLGLSAAPAQAGAALTIVPTFDSTITSLSNAAAIEGTINSAISVYEADFSNPITVTIDFSNMTSGLGESSFNLADNTPYADYRNALIADKAKGTDNTAFLASLPASGNPVPGQSASGVEDTTAGLRAIGLNAPASTLVNGTNYDGQILLNTALTNITRTGAQNPGKYDLQSVTEHEIDEILGFNSDLDTGFPAGVVGPTDFFRFNGLNSRSYTVSTSEKAYFSIDGGKTAVDQASDGVGVFFNQGSSGDRHDFAPSAVGTVRVQDAFGTPGRAPNLGVGELTGLDVIGYNADSPSAAPEPAETATLGLVGLGLGGLLLHTRKRMRA